MAEWADIRDITADDPCPKCGKKIRIEKAIEVGHTFKLGTRYTESLGAKFLDEKGKEKPIIMGCYGIGVNRILASAIEQNNDKDGILWPVGLAPFQVIILPLDSTDKELQDTAEKIYKDCKKEGFEAILDDRPERAGIKFKDADLIGIPVKVIIGRRTFDKGKVEVKLRNAQKAQLADIQNVNKTIKNLLTST